jgi:hypothetical protein
MLYKDKLHTWKTFDRRDDYVISLFVFHGGPERKNWLQVKEFNLYFRIGNRIIELSCLTDSKGKK